MRAQKEESQMAKDDGFNNALEQIKQEREGIKQRQMDMGPDKFGLMPAFFVKGATVEFRVNEGSNRFREIKVQVNSVQAEDGSRESWNLDGYIIAMRTPLTQGVFKDLSEYKKFKAYYDTRSHKGHILF